MTRTLLPSPVSGAGAAAPPAGREAGWWRVTADASLEVLLARPTGIVETYVGRARGAEFETGTKDVALTPLAKEVTGTRRRYTLREEGELTVAHGVAAVGRPLQHRPTTHLCRRP